MLFVSSLVTFVEEYEVRNSEKLHETRRLHHQTPSDHNIRHKESIPKSGIRAKNSFLLPRRRGSCRCPVLHALIQHLHQRPELYRLRHVLIRARNERLEPRRGAAQVGGDDDLHASVRGGFLLVVARGPDGRMMDRRRNPLLVRLRI